MILKLSFFGKMRRCAFIILPFLFANIGDGRKIRGDDLMAEIATAKQRLRSDYIEKLWVSASQTIVTSQYNILKLYTTSTIEQAQQVVDYIATRSNLTRFESENTLKNALGKKNFTLVECIIKKEINTVQAYKTTGYNLHNCIRMAQINTEAKHLEVVNNFENIKQSSLRFYEFYNRHLDNCADNDCVMSTLIQSVIQFEKLKEELSGNVTEVNNLSSRYLLTNIAMGCVASAINQVYDNYNIGKKLSDDCFIPSNNTVTNSTRISP